MAKAAGGSGYVRGDKKVTSIGKSRRSRPKNKSKRLNRKKYRGQGK
jgi:hypothetical protein